MYNRFFDRLSGQFEPELSSPESLARIARVEGLPKSEAVALVEWLKTRGHKIIGLVEHEDETMVVWEK
jgi:hypothetical protein